MLHDQKLTVYFSFGISSPGVHKQTEVYSELFRFTLRSNSLHILQYNRAPNILLFTLLSIDTRSTVPCALVYSRTATLTALQGSYRAII